MSDLELLQEMGTDARLWAAEFVRAADGCGGDYGVDFVTTWFANAIEAGALRSDPWRMDEWSALPDTCFIAACEGEADQRGPIHLRDGSINKACTEHWEPIMRVLGEQSSWECGDAHRSWS